MKIQIFVTGGTFDKEYNELTEKLVFRDTHLGEMLKLGRCTLDIEVRTLMLVDSLDMKTSDLKIILENCRACKRDKIVITHGTGTMETTARFLGENITNKTIVLTGAMIPYKYGSSDGLFNLGAAVGFVQSLPVGVYVTMNGKCFLWDNVHKNLKTGSFEKIKK